MFIRTYCNSKNIIFRPLYRYETTIKGLEMVQSTMKQQLHDAELEVKEQAEKHHEILQYSQSLTENNASSKASAAELQAKVGP